jgi:hypothetical protein
MAERKYGGFPPEESASIHLIDFGRRLGSPLLKSARSGAFGLDFLKMICLRFGGKPQHAAVIAEQ